jgi:hypothetical protein
VRAEGARSGLRASGVQVRPRHRRACAVWATGTRDLPGALVLPPWVVTRVQGTPRSIARSLARVSPGPETPSASFPASLYGLSFRPLNLDLGWLPLHGGLSCADNEKETPVQNNSQVAWVWSAHTGPRRHVGHVQGFRVLWA